MTEGGKKRSRTKLVSVDEVRFANVFLNDVIVHGLDSLVIAEDLNSSRTKEISTDRRVK